MSRRKTGQAVSLFPFLAVLVSAMGALILLLLVTTRKLHNDAVQKAKAEQAVIQAQKNADAEAARNAVPLPLPEDHPAFQTDAAEFVIAIESPAKQLLPPSPPSEPDRTLEKEQLRREWEERLAELRNNWERLQQRLLERQALVSDQTLTEAELAAELARLQEAINKLQEEKGDLSQDVETSKLTKKSIAQQIAELQAELERLKTEKTEQSTKFQLVPYAGTSPTRRRPIVIECEANTIRFASEDIPLTARDMSGFSAEYNPVRAGAEALLQYWEVQRKSSSSMAAMQPEPYLLFVIRPGGTVSYYVTRRMLEGLPVDSGYELVTESQELIWPTSSDEARQACQLAIDEVLGIRNRLASQSKDGRVPVAEELQYEGPQGEFYLDEVQKLRNPEQKSFVGGRRITRAERPRAGTSGYKPPTAPDRGGFVGPKLEDLKDELGRMPSRRPVPQEARTADRSFAGRPFPTEPPPRTGTQSAQGTATDSAGLDEAVGTSGPVQKLDPHWKSQHPGTAVDPDRMQLMTPEELARHSNLPSSARGAVGNYQEEGRGEGQASGEATSQFAGDGEVNDLFSSTTGQDGQPRLEHRPPTNSVEPTGNRMGLQDGSPGGDRKEATETTDDPQLAGESKPEGVAGGKGTWEGAGGSVEAAPETIPVQVGPASGGPGGSQSQPDSTEEIISRHVPRPLPTPAPNSITAERFVVVTIDSSHVQVGNRQIPIEVGESDHALQQQFSQELAAQAKRWGRAPAGFHWQPAIRFRVRPGGNQYYAWLHSASDDWGLRQTVEYVFD